MAQETVVDKFIDRLARLGCPACNEQVPPEPELRKTKNSSGVVQIPDKLCSYGSRRSTIGRLKTGVSCLHSRGGADFEGIEFLCVFWGLAGRAGQWSPTAERRGRPHEQGRRANRFAPMAGGAHRARAGNSAPSHLRPERAHLAAAAGLWVAETALNPALPRPLEFAVDSAIGPRQPAGRLHQESGSYQAAFLRLT